MILDLTTQPVTVSVDECLTSLVVRTWAAFGVNGILERLDKTHPRALKEHLEVLKPAAQLTQGAITCYETRVPLPVAREERCWSCDSLPNADCRICNWMGGDIKILPNPWEVATGAKDVVTGATLTWRAALQVFQHPKNHNLWIVEVSRVGDPQRLVRLATKSLSMLPFKSDTLPLHKHAKATANEAPSLWARLTEDD